MALSAPVAELAHAHMDHDHDHDHAHGECEICPHYKVNFDQCPDEETAHALLITPYSQTYSFKTNLEALVHFGQAIIRGPPLY